MGNEWMVIADVITVILYGIVFLEAIKIHKILLSSGWLLITIASGYALLVRIIWLCDTLEIICSDKEILGTLIGPYGLLVMVAFIWFHGDIKKIMKK
jgi:hypothetical protein